MPFSTAFPPPLMRIAMLLWAAPLTLVGLALALPARLAGGRWKLQRGGTAALLVQGSFIDWMLRRHPAGGMHAMAIGHVVIAMQGLLSPRLLAHELEHVRQAERWGPLFPVLYVLSSVWQLLHGREAYRDNHFEVAARAAEQHVVMPKQELRG